MMFKFIKRSWIKSKSALLLFLLVFFSIGLFSSCSWWEKQIKTEKEFEAKERGCSSGNAPFLVEQITKSSNDKEITVSYGEDGLANDFTLNLKACIKDFLRPDTPIQDAPFVIEYYNSLENKKKDKKERVEALTDTQGCIQWQEKYKYKYTIKPIWINLKRTINKEKGTYAGQEEISMAINPWLSSKDKEDGLPSILDTRCEYSRNHHVLDEKQNHYMQGLEYISETKLAERPLLWVPRISVQIREINNNKRIEFSKKQDIKSLLKKYKNLCGKNQDHSCYERELETVFYIPLQLRTLGMSSLVHRDINGGTYDIETQLIISPEENKKNYRLHKRICEHKEVSLNQINKSLSLICRLDISYFNQNALYKLVLRIKPSSHRLPFKKFEGVYTVNLDFKNKNQRKDFSIDTVYDEAYKNVINTGNELEIINGLEISNIYSIFQSSENKSKKTNGKLEQQKGDTEVVNFYSLHLDGYGDFKLSHINSGKKCEERENVVQRTAVFLGKICLTDVLSSQKLNNTYFRVFLERTEEEYEEIFLSKKQGKNRLFRTDGRSCISIPIEVKHELYNRQKYFQVDVHILSEELNLYGKVRLALNPWQRAFQAFQDAQHVHKDNIRFNTEGIPKPEFVINQFRSINLFPSYGLDKLLNIHLFHRFYLLFQPFVKRLDNLSLGRDHRARELLRDGFYLVRVLILRNPQETGHSGVWSRVGKVEDQDKARKSQVTENRISLKDSRYITHTDSVVEAKANFINFYMPLYLSTKQLYYVASRNFIVIEIHPANPKKFVFDDENSSSECSVNLQKTKWEPFLNHELQSSPYAGAINIQNWTNWNLLQPVKDVNTDKIIEQSEIGKKYKHFNFSSFSNDTNNTQKEVVEKKSLSSLLQDRNPDLQILQTECVNDMYQNSEMKDIEKELSQYQGKAPFNFADIPNSEVEKCDKGKPLTLNSAIEDHRDKEKHYSISDVLGRFAQENSLKIIDISKKEGTSFLQDLKTSFEKYKMFLKNPRKFIHFNLQSIYNMDKVFDQNKLKILKLDNLDKNFFNHIPEQVEREILRVELIGACGYFIFSIGSIVNSECVKDRLTSYIVNKWLLSRSSNSLFSIYQLIVDRNLLEEKEQKSFKEVRKCIEKQGARDCYNKARPYIIKAMDFVLNKIETDSSSLNLERLRDVKKEFYLLSEMLLNFFSIEEKKEYLKNIDNFNKHTYSPNEYREYCYKKLKEIYLKKNYFQKEKQKNWLSAHFRSLIKVDSNEALLRNFFQSNGEESITEELLFSIMIPPDRINVQSLIDEGIKLQNRDNERVRAFVKPLCFFWFDFYLKDYLEKEQMISAYTNYIRKFDYHQILEDNTMSYKEKTSVLPDFLEQLILENENDTEITKCYSKYSECLIIDHCQDRVTNQSKKAFCPNVQNIKDNTCSNLLKNECSKRSSLSLCEDPCLFNSQLKGCGEKNYCNTRVQSFCLVNVAHPLCERYDNRCSSNYLPCLKENKKSSLFNIDNTIKYKEESFPLFPPLETCLRDPYEFFKFENKMIVKEISKKTPQYKGGFLRNIFISASFSIGSYMNWTAQRGRAISISAKASLPFPGFLKILSADFSANQSIHSNESNSARRAIDSRSGEGIYLSIGTSEITMRIKKFQKCLVIKPRPNAFTAKIKQGEPELYKSVWTKNVENKNFKKIMSSRPGLILCNPLEERKAGEEEEITESYYYISQQLESHSVQFLNLYDLANRPFLLILRGKREFIKLYHLLRLGMEGGFGSIEENGEIYKAPENAFIEYNNPIEETIGLTLSIREFNETGFHPGVYDYPDDVIKELDIWFGQTQKDDGQSLQSLIMPPLEKYNYFDIPQVPSNALPIQKN